MNAKKNIIKDIYFLLLNRYGEQGWWPIAGKYNSKFKDRKKTPNERFEIAVGAILTQSTNWKNVEVTLENLRNKKKLGLEKIDKLSQKQLASLIRSSGYHNQKSKKLKEFCKFYKTNKKPARKKLLQIWGIGPETADSILLYGYDEPWFIADAYTKRIMHRLGLCNEKATYTDIQKLVHKNLEKKPAIFNEYHALIVKHAKEHCKTKPKCEKCPLNRNCKHGKI